MSNGTVVGAVAAVALVVVLGLAVAGGPVVWALVVMIGAPFALLFMLSRAGHENSENQHFAPDPRRR